MLLIILLVHVTFSSAYILNANKMYRPARLISPKSIGFSTSIDGSDSRFSPPPLAVATIGSADDSVEDSSVMSEDDDAPGAFNRIKKASKIIYKFCRPHTIKGTILASSMGVIRALIENPDKFSRRNLISLVPRAVIGLIALLCGNAYIVGINQIYDVQIDEINKPFLPIAAKLMTKDFAWKLIIGCLLTGIGIVKTQFSSQIFGLYSIGIVLGTLYSVPPIQLKRKAFFAGSIIAFVRGFLLNFGVYYAVREALEIPFKWNPVVAFISSFMTCFATVIAITKDLPDVEGDKKYDIETFASKYGVGTVARLASALLTLAYVAAVAVPFVPALGGPSFNRAPMVGGHAAFLVYFLWSFLKFDKDADSTPVSLKRFYKSIWNLFYLEYCLYPFI